MIAELATDAVFDSDLAVDATYTAAGGDPVSVRVLWDRRTLFEDLDTQRIASGAVTFRIRVSEVAGPAYGDTVTVDGTVYHIHSTVPLRSPSGSVWELMASDLPTG